MTTCTQNVYNLHMKEERLSVKIETELKQKAMEKAIKNDLTLSQVIRKLLQDYVNDKQGKLNF